MKHYLHAFWMTQTMFCAIPVPGKIWDENARSKMLLFLPVVGLEIGGLWFGLSRLCAYLRLPTLLTALALTAYPFLVTGFIHLDGFLDVLDALRSWRSQEKRIEILKDPHVGSMAVVGCVLVLLAQFSAFSGGIRNDLVLVFIPVVSRCCSAAAVTMLRPISVSQYARQEIHKKQAYILLGMLVLTLGCAGWLLKQSALALLAALILYGIALRRGVRNLGGVNGDIAGYSLTIAETAAVIASVLL